MRCDVFPLGFEKLINHRNFRSLWTNEIINVGARKLASRNRYFLRRILPDSDFSELKTPRFRREIDFFLHFWNWEKVIPHPAPLIYPHFSSLRLTRLPDSSTPQRKHPVTKRSLLWLIKWEQIIKCDRSLIWVFLTPRLSRRICEFLLVCVIF